MVCQIFDRMISFFEGDQREINHFIKVWTYARNIAELEKISPEDKFILEVAAIVHDIACPSIRAKYGSCEGKLQEEEGPAIARNVLSEFDLSDEQLERVLFLIAHHHTYEGVDGIDYQILLEADYIVNADESSYSVQSIKKMYETVFKTAAGKDILRRLYIE